MFFSPKKNSLSTFGSLNSLYNIKYIPTSNLHNFSAKKYDFGHKNRVINMNRPEDEPEIRIETSPVKNNRNM